MRERNRCKPVLSAHREMNWIKATRPPICYRNHHLRRPDIDITDIGDMRKSLSNLKKDIKYRLGGKKRAPDRAGGDAAGERISSSASLLRPDSRVAASGHNEEGSRISTDISQACSRDPSPQPKPVPVDEGRRDDPQSNEADVGGKEADHGGSRLDPDVKIAAGSGPSREDKRAHSPPPVTSIPLKQEPDSTWTVSPRLLYLIVPLHNADASAAPDRTQKELSPDENTESNATASDKKSNWKSTAYASAKLLLRGVRDSADAFGPLKSVAGGLCFILENCEVWSSPMYTIEILISTPANEGERANNRVVGTQGEGTC